MMRRLISNKTVVVCLFILTAICLMGAFAPYLAPHDPNLADVINSMMPMSMAVSYTHLTLPTTTSV